MKKMLLCVALACCASAFMLAQSSDTKGKGSTRSVTGCLQKTSEANEFLLLGNDGSSWEVKSDAVTLADHVGHEVTATGTVSHAKAHDMKEDSKDMAHDAGMDKHNAEHGHMKVTDLQMVSTSCSK